MQMFPILINYYELTMSCCMENSVDLDQLADLDLHSFQFNFIYIYSFLTSLCMVINKIRDELGSLCIIC